MYGLIFWWRNRSFLRNRAIRSFAFVLLFSFLLGASSIFSNSVSASSYTFNLTTSGAQNIDVSTTGTGTAIGIDNITVATTCHAGYNLTLSTSVDDNNLYLNGDTSNNTAGTFFAPVDGATNLATADNAWGYYLPDSGGNAPTSSSVFNAVPVLGSPSSLRTASQTASATDISDSFSVYYGVSASSNMMSGTYKMKKDGSNNDGSLVYYATLAEACFSYTVQFNPTSTAGGNTISGTGTMSNQTIYEDVATALTSNGFTAPSGYEFVGWNTAQDGTGTAYADGQSVTNLTTVGSSIILYAQWETECPGGSICYRANGDNVEGTMGNQSISASDTSAILLASNFSREGYGFAGWSTTYDYSDTSGFFGPQETITFSAGQYTGSNPGLKLHAIWVESVGNLQDTNKVATLCDTGSGGLTAATYDDKGDNKESTWSIVADLSSVSALTDARDNQTYAIAKLPDGNCWMIENLRLENGAVHNSDGTLAQGYGTSSTYGNFSGLAMAESSGFSSTYSANSLYSNNGSNNTININTSGSPAYRMPRYNNSNNKLRSADRPQNPTTNDAVNSSTNAGMYSYGNYYSWAAAVADTTYISTSDYSVTVTSLCPYGWHLPTGTGSGEFGKLSNSLGGKKNSSGVAQIMTSSDTPDENTIIKRILHFPNNFVNSGQISGNTISQRGTDGFYWSSTAKNSSNAYSLGFGSDYVFDPANHSVSAFNIYKYIGRSIRCIASVGI